MKDNTVIRQKRKVNKERENLVRAVGIAKFKRIQANPHKEYLRNLDIKYILAEEDCEWIVCPKCEGRGFLYGKAKSVKMCPDCFGTRIQRIPHRRGSDY